MCFDTRTNLGLYHFEGSATSLYHIRIFPSVPYLQKHTVPYESTASRSVTGHELNTVRSSYLRQDCREEMQTVRVNCIGMLIWLSEVCFSVVFRWSCALMCVKFNTLCSNVWHLYEEELESKDHLDLFVTCVNKTKYIYIWSFKTMIIGVL